MQTVILAAGRGVRMGELTNDLPKPMLRINGQPILEYSLANLPEEISEIIFVIGYKGDLIRVHFGNEYKDKKIRYVWQKDLNGSAAALHQAKDFLEDKFLVLNGDDLYQRSDLEKLIKNEAPALLVKEIESSEKFGVVKTNNKGNLLEVIESGRQRDENLNLVNIGAYLLNKEFFDYQLVKKSMEISEKEFGLPQTIAKMAKDYKIKVEKAKFWQPIGYPEDILKAEKIITQFSSKL
jgi:bifunctional UDP-N-acetylglucosamine pyrophosphorylase/glucosamine-1-phosphate N-acetyltransferase